jgi:hypothetical protein
LALQRVSCLGGLLRPHATAGSQHRGPDRGPFRPGWASVIDPCSQFAAAPCDRPAQTDWGGSQPGRGESVPCRGTQAAITGGPDATEQPGSELPTAGVLPRRDGRFRRHEMSPLHSSEWKLEGGVVCRTQQPEAISSGQVSRNTSTRSGALPKSDRESRQACPARVVGSHQIPSVWPPRGMPDGMDGLR